MVDTTADCFQGAVPIGRRFDPATLTHLLAAISIVAGLGLHGGAARAQEAPVAEDDTAGLLDELEKSQGEAPTAPEPATANAPEESGEATASAPAPDATAADPAAAVPPEATPPQDQAMAEAQPPEEKPAEEQAEPAAPEVLETIPVAQKPQETPKIAEPPRGRQLEEIIVTAQKREERLQDVPVAVSAFSGKELEDKNATTLGDIKVPNVEMGSGGALNHYFVRGIGSNFEQGVEQSVVLFIDDVAYTDRVNGLSSFLDLERVEFLRGPQGTLFGKNTVAGAVNMYTRKPVHEWEARASTYYGSDNDRGVEGVVNVPVGESFAMRIGGTWAERDGYVYNTYLDTDTGDRQAWGVNVKSLLDMADAGEVILGFRYNVNRQDNGAPTEKVRNSSGGPNTPYDLIDPQFDAVQNHRSSKDAEEYMDSSGWTANLRYTKDFNSGYALNGMLAYTESDWVLQLDGDQAPVPVALARLSTLTDGVQAELRLSSPQGLFDGRFDFISGFYGNLDHEDTLADVGLVVVDSGSPGMNSAQGIYNERDRDVLTLAAYSQGTLKLTENNDIILGARYSWVQTHLNKLSQAYPLLGLNQVLSPLNIPGLSGIPSALNLLGLKDITLADRERTDTSPTGKISWRYHFGDSGIFFLTAAQGFKAGGFPLSTANENEPGYKPEDSLLYEAGVKLVLFDSMLQVNATAFKTTYKNFQVIITENFVDVVKNAAAAENAGAELETKFVLPLGLMASLNFAWLPTARFTDYKDGPCQTNEDDGQGGGACDRSGARLPFAPEWSASGSLAGEWPLSENLLLMAGVDATWTDELLFQSDGDPIDSREKLTRVNARTGVVSADRHWSLQFFVDNLTNQIWEEYSNNDVDGGGHYAFTSRPRSYVARLTWSF